MLSDEQVAACVTVVQQHGWTWEAMREAAPVLGIHVPNSGCWPDLAKLGLLGAVCQVACELQDSPASLCYLDLVGGTLPQGTVLPASLERLDLGGCTLPPGTVAPATCRVYL